MFPLIVFFHFLRLFCETFNIGLAQCAELCWQLRGEAGKRQVPGAKLALQHNLGLGGAVVMGIYRLGFPEATRKWQIQYVNLNTVL